MEALVAYSFRARIRDITDMEITIEQSSDPNATINFHVKNEQGLSEIQIHEVTFYFLQNAMNN